MEKINDILYELFMEELHDLELGYGFNKNRLAAIRSIVTMLLYLRYAVLSDNEVLKILEIYEHI